MKKEQDKKDGKDDDKPKGKVLVLTKKELNEYCQKWEAKKKAKADENIAKVGVNSNLNDLANVEIDIDGLPSEDSEKYVDPDI